MEIKLKTKYMFTIQVFDKKTGKPAFYKRVGVLFRSDARGAAKDQYTDRNGEAHFPEENGNGEIFIDGITVYKGRVEGRKVVYV